MKHPVVLHCSTGACSLLFPWSLGAPRSLGTPLLYWSLAPWSLAPWSLAPWSPVLPGVLVLHCPTGIFLPWRLAPLAAPGAPAKSPCTTPPPPGGRGTPALPTPLLGKSHSALVAYRLAKVAATSCPPTAEAAPVPPHLLLEGEVLLPTAPVPPLKGTELLGKLLEKPLQRATTKSSCTTLPSSMRERCS